MIGRILLGLMVIVSVAWISFVGFDILNVKSNYSPESTFNSKDGKVLVINRLSEIDLLQLDRFEEAPMYKVTNAILAKKVKTVFVSYKQAQLLIKGDGNWEEESISELFNQISQDIVFSGSNFSFGEYEGRFFKSSLYLKIGEVEKANTVESNFYFDNKATASIISINEDSDIYSISDIYFLNDGKVNYITKNDDILQGKQVKDEAVFASLLTSKLSNYHFRERDFYSTVDSVFSNGPMSQWINNGFVEFNYKGNRAFVTDYIDGQDPILILNDLRQTQDEKEFSYTLTENFPSKGKSFFIKYLEDLVVISESEITCDNVIADYKLGNTVALNQLKWNRLYGQLPQKVSERFISDEIAFSKAVYKGKILQTQFGVVKSEILTEKQETVSLNTGFDIENFAVLKGVGNIVVLGKQGELVMFENGELKWKKTLSTQASGDVQIIDLFSNGEDYVLLNTTDKIHLWNSKGEYSPGFPVSLENEATNEVKFYRWKGKSYFLIADNNQKVLKFDGEGRELNILKSQDVVTKKIDVWASQNKLFAGFSNDAFFEMFSLEKNKNHREFNLPVRMQTVKVPNEIVQFGIESSRLVKVDQKGIKSSFDSFENGKLLKIINVNKNPIVIIQSANELSFVNIEGIPFSQFRIPFNEVEDVHVSISNSGKTAIAIIDGLENNVYLYDVNGKLIRDKALEGQREVILKNIGNSLQTTTIIDQFIVQYFD